MNLSIRDIEQLYITEDNKPNLKWVEYLMNHEYDNIYLIDEKKQFIGYVNNQSLKEYYKTGELSINKTIYVDKNNENFDANNWFKNHPEIYRLPVIESGKIVKEFYNLGKVGANEDLVNNQNAIKKMSIFTKQIRVLCQNMNWRSISCICNKEELIQLQKIFGSDIRLRKYQKKETSDVLLDLYFTKTYRKLLLKTKQEVCTLHDLVSSAAVISVKEYIFNRHVNSIFMSGPKKKQLHNMYFDEIDALYHSKNIQSVINRQEYINKIYRDDLLSKEYILHKIYGISNASRVISNGIHKLLLDQRNPYVNIINGERVTTNYPECFENKIHVYGPCIAQGLCVTDSKTIESFLQRMLNEKLTSKYAVVNHGVGDGGDFLNDLIYLLNTNLHSGDIVIIINEFTDLNQKVMSKYEIKKYECDALFDQKHYWFINHPYHCNANANQLIAQYLLQLIENFPECKKNVTEIENYWVLNNLDVHEDKNALLKHEELKEYEENLKLYRLKNCEEKQIGSIVMNANPFTLGHKYLVEYAAKLVDHLYIFIVQENSDAFSFLDRFYMVQEGCHEYTNVTVLSGGKIMASVYSFPAYFQRNGTYDVNVDPSMHLRIFAEQICPILGINQRFFGEEPTDEVTNQLNIYANDVLPGYGVKVTIIKRKKEKGEYISAGTVRRMMQEGRYEEIRNYVPASTFNRLIELSKREG